MIVLTDFIDNLISCFFSINCWMLFATFLTAFGTIFLGIVAIMPIFEKKFLSNKKKMFAILKIKDILSSIKIKISCTIKKENKNIKYLEVKYNDIQINLINKIEDILKDFHEYLPTNIIINLMSIINAIKYHEVGKLDTLISDIDKTINEINKTIK